LNTNENSKIDRLSEELSRLYDLRKQIDEQYDEIKEKLIKEMKKDGIKRVATKNKNITMSETKLVTYSYPVLESKIIELDIFDKVVKTSINREALEREIETGFFPIDLAKKAKNINISYKILVKDKTE
jgi:hypothetical protein